MPLHALFDWLAETERKHQSVFFLEWIALQFLFYQGLSIMLQQSWASFEISNVKDLIIVGVSALISIVIISQRNRNVTGCVRCLVLPNLRQELERKYINHEERFYEMQDEGSGATYFYAKTFRIDRVKFRCKRCGVEWSEMQATSASPYRRVGSNHR